MSRLNWNREFAMEQAADDVELLEELIEIFKDSYKKDLDLIKKGIDMNDAEQICSAAHSIKGAAASLGILGIRDVALSIEEDSKKGSFSVAIDQHNSMEELLQDLMQL